MTNRSHRTHSPVSKAKVALAAIKSDTTVAELMHQFDVHPNQITTWTTRASGRCRGLFSRDSGSAEASVDLKALHAKIGELALESDFLVRRAQKGWPAERKEMIDRGHHLPVVRQAKVVNLARSTAYYEPRPVSAG